MGSWRRLGARSAVFTAVLLALLAVLVPLGSESLAGTDVLSNGGYTAFVVAGNGSSVQAFNAATPGAAENPVVTQPGTLQDVAIDPKSEEVLATIDADDEDNGVSGVVAYSAFTGQQIGPPVAIPGLDSPGPIAVSPDGTTAWVGDWNSGKVVALSLPSSGPAAPTVPAGGPTITVPGGNPGVCALAVSPDGSQLYVGVNSEVQDPGTPCLTTQIDGSSRNTPELFAYATNGASGAPPTWADRPLVNIPGAISVPGSVSALGVTPTGSTLYVAVSSLNEDDDPVSGRVVEVAASTGAVVEPEMSLPATGASYADPVDLAITPDGSTLYVADGAGSGDVSEVGLTVPPGPTQVLPVPDPTALAVTPDGSNLLVTSNTGLSSVLISQNVPLPAGAPSQIGLSSPWAIAITPDQAPAAALTANPPGGTAGVSVTLSAAASTVRYGSIGSYVWNFGDGTPSVTTMAPTDSVTHVYGTAGTYTATVTETDSAGTSIAPAFGTFPVDFTGQTASKQSAPTAETSTVVTITRPLSTPPPPPTTGTTTPAPTTSHPTTTSPPTTASHPGTTAPKTKTTTKPGTTTTTIPATTTTTLAPPPPGSPTLTVNPGLGPPGLVTQFSGQDFPANTAITVQWSPGIGSAVVTSSSTGTISGSILIMYHDEIGDRVLAAVGYPTATAPFLVVPSPEEPAGSSDQFLFRR
jgi:hypothetical protein